MKKNDQIKLVYLSWLLIINIRGFPYVNICMVKHAMECLQAPHGRVHERMIDEQMSSPKLDILLLPQKCDDG